MVAQNEAVFNGIVRPLEMRVLPHCLIIKPQIKPSGLKVIMADNRKRAVGNREEQYPNDKYTLKLHKTIVTPLTSLPQKRWDL